jgi:hypothetical protein
VLGELRPPDTRPRTFLQRLKAFEGDLELVGVIELGGVVKELDAEEGDDRHDGGV